MSILVVTLRPALESDQALLLRVYAATRTAELALTGWDEMTCSRFVQMQFLAQSTHYRLHWPASEHSVIQVQSQDATVPVGRLWIDRRAKAIHVLDIALLPHWRSQGIGAQCLQRLMSEVSQKGDELSIQVEQDNPARRLYDRLGFESVGPQRGLHQLMVWRSPANAALPREEACYEQA